MVKVCVTGCLHGELDRVYADISSAERIGQFKTDLVLCCGDFQSVRNPGDLASMSIPTKYYAMGDFWRYYAEEAKAPIPTIFIGGNHEASSYLHELPYGGWVAPNIWYMGYAGVIQFAGLRIAGLSGIYKQHDYTMGHYERPPYSESTKRSVYHIRNLEVFRLGQLRRRLDIVLSHDWPRGIYHYGNTGRLVQRKRHFREEIDTDSLGSPPGEQLFCRLQPRYWFAAHLHCKFAAVVEHANDSSDKRSCTRFLALDKCLPNRDYLQFLDIDPDPKPVFMSALNDESAIRCDNDDPVIVDPVDSRPSTPDEADGETYEGTSRNSFYLDPEWLCILRTTNHLMSTHQVPCILPGQSANERCDFSVNRADIHSLLEPFGGHFAIPENFERTAPVYKTDDSGYSSRQSLAQQANAAVQAALANDKSRPQVTNPQTELMCAMLDLLNPTASLRGDGTRQRDAASLLESSYRRADDDSDDDDEEEEVEVDDDVGQNGDSAQQPELTAQPTQTTDSTGGANNRQHDEYDPLESSVDSSRLVYPPGNNHGPTTGEDEGGHTAYGSIIHNPEEVNLDDDDLGDDGVADVEADPAEYRTGDSYTPQAYSPTATLPVQEIVPTEPDDGDALG